MRVRIQKTMVLILGLALLLLLWTFSFYCILQNLNLLKSEVKQEARYIQTAVNIVGPDYLERLDNVEVNTRVTRIGADGTVLYDSGRDEKSLENHKDREEIKQALASGEGEITRMSDTRDREMYYYATLLEDGSVLRVSKEYGKSCRNFFSDASGYFFAGRSHDLFYDLAGKLANSPADQTD